MVVNKILKINYEKFIENEKLLNCAKKYELEDYLKLIKEIKKNPEKTILKQISFFYQLN